MKFVLNMSFSPHFVALFDAENHLVETISWENFREGSQYVWNFLDKHQIGHGTDLTFIGGVSGPVDSLRCGLVERLLTRSPIVLVYPCTRLELIW